VDVTQPSSETKTSPRRSRTTPRCGAILVALLTCVPASACGGDGAATTAPSAGARGTTATEAAAPPKATERRTIRFRATDGVRLHGTLTAGRGGRAPAIVLVHQYKGTPYEWDATIRYLHAAGYAVLEYPSRSPTEDDETVLARDVRGAIAALRRRRDVDGRRIGVLGASIGATTAAWVAGSRPDQRLKAAIGLTPQETDAIRNAAAADRFRPHDLLLVADAQELVGARAIRTDVRGSGVTVAKSLDEGHGVELMDYPPVRRAVIDWLNSRMRST
jgi:acetyl esterase/lipase